MTSQVERDLSHGAPRVRYLLWACTYWRKQMKQAQRSASYRRADRCGISLKRKQRRLAQLRFDRGEG